MLWTNRQFWLDTTWRSFRTFCQTLAGLLAAQFSGLLQAAGQSTVTTHAPWAAFLYASGIAALISLLQSVDRERAVNAAPVAVADAPAPAMVPLMRSVIPEAAPVAEVVPLDVAHTVSTFCGDGK